MFTWTENAEASMWGHLSFLGHPNNCRRLLRGELQSNRTFGYFDPSKLEEKTNQVSMSIRQAKEYFDAAKSASIATSPMLYFYGMLSLAKALVVANREDLFIQSINSHGLTNKTNKHFPALQTYEANKQQWQMEDEFAIQTDGLFPEFMDVVHGPKLPNRAVFRFRDILAICPEIGNIYEKYYGEPPGSIACSSLTRNGQGLVELPLYCEPNYAIRAIPALSNDYVAPGPGSNVFTQRAGTEPFTSLGPYHSVLGGEYIVRAVPYELAAVGHVRYISPTVADYIGMFILSICVRYKPDFWATVIEGRQSGVLGLIELYISIVARRFPNMILNKLFNEHFDYGSPGRLT